MPFAPPAVEPAETALPQLVAGSPVARQTAAGERFELALAAPSGNYLRVGADVRGITASVRLLGSDGAELATAGPRGGADRRALALVTPADGGYRLEVAAAAGTGRGLVRLELEELRAAAPGDVERVAVERALAGRLSAALAGPPGAAVSVLEEAVAHHRRVGDRRGEVAALNALAEQLNDRDGDGDLEAAAGMLERAVDAAHAAGWGLTEADALNNLAWARSGQGRPQESVELYRRALAVLDREEDLREMGRTFRRLGVVALRRLGDADTAGPAFERALELSRTTGDLQCEGWASSGLGDTAMQRADHARALGWYESARTLYQRVGDRVGEASADRAMAHIHESRGEPQRALELYDRALATTADERTRGLTLHDLALVHLGLGDHDEALARARQALEVFSGKGSKDEVDALSTVSDVLQARGDLPAALQQYETALGLARRVDRASVSRVLVRLARARLAHGEPRPALAALEEALEVHREKTMRPFDEAVTLLELGSAHRALGHPERAAEAYDRALAIARRLGQAGLIAPNLLRRAALARDRGDLESALDDVQEAIEIVESVRSRVGSSELRTSFLAAKRAYYELHLDVLARLAEREPGAGHREEMLAASERGRARGLLDLLAEGRIDVDRGVEPDLRRRETELARALTEAASRLERARAAQPPDAAAIAARDEELLAIERRQDELEREIRARNPRYAEVRYPEPLAAADVRRLLDERTALLEYWLGREGSFLFVITRARTEVHRLPPAAEIERLVEDVRSAVDKRRQLTLGRYVRAASELYRLLLVPAAGTLADKPDLLIVPDGALHALPFEVLLTDAAASRGLPWKRLPYLLRRHSVAYVPSASVLAGLRQPRSAPEPRHLKRFVAFADPFYGEGAATSHAAVRGAPAATFARLPQTAREVAGIASLYPASEVEIYLDRRASKANLRASPYLEGAQRIHFATHGHLDERRPELSGLVLALPEDGSDNGILRVHEIFNLDLSADLVTLSACETGLGKQVASEGLVGLSRAFFYAGARSLLVSLWNVSEDSTPDLMIELYRRLERGESKAEALRHAKLGLLEGSGSASHPFHWAPFVLVGDLR